MTDIDTLKRIWWAFFTALTHTIVPTIFMISSAVALTAMQVAFAAPNPP
jgi:hypothetical protein